jgi:hypothetical protein
MVKIAQGLDPATGLGGLENIQARLQAEFTDAIQKYLDDFAATRGYDSIFTATTYATSSSPRFGAEGRYAVEARDAVWKTAYEILDAVMAGKRSKPSLEEVFAELPTLRWPDAE